MEEEELFDRTQLITPTTGALEGLGAAMDLAKFDTFLESWRASSKLDELKNSKSWEILPREQLNEMFPGLDKPFTEDMNRYAAELIYKRTMDKRKLQEKIAAGPDNMFYGVAKFGAQMIPHALDPVELGAGILGGYALGAGAAAVGGIARLGLTSTGRLAVGATNTQRFLTASADGVIGNLMVEPVIAGGFSDFQENYTVADAFISVAGGAVGFAAFSSVARASVNMFKYGSNPVDSFAANLGPKANDILYKSTLGQMLQGKAPRIHAVLASYVDDIKVKPGDEPTGIIRPDENTFYISAHNKGASLSDAKLEKFFDDYDGAAHAITDPDVANNAATRSINDMDGEVIEVRFPDGAKLYDLNAPLDGDLKAAIIKAVDNAIPESKFEGLSGKESMDLIRSGITDDLLPDDAFTKVKLEMQSMGYAGYRHDGSSHLGRKQDPVPTAILFDRNGLTETRRIPGRRGTISQDLKDKARDLAKEEQSINREMFHNEDAMRAMEEASVEIKELNRVEMDADSDLILKELEDTGLDVAPIREQLSDLKKEADLVTRAINAAYACVRGA